jgi:hypothetical protein
LPVSPKSFLFTALAGAIALAGCTTSGMDVGAELQAAAETAPDIADPELPETVALVPQERGADPDTAGMRVASYAGPTPTSPVDTVFAPDGRFGSGNVAARSPELDALIARYADHYDVPEELVRRVVKRESTFNPAARNGPYWGLMQIRHDTARGMGYDGPASGLLDAETNLKYAVRYLRGAYITAGGNQDQAVRLYARGYYYDAKAKGLLEETGLRGPRRRMPETQAAEPEVVTPETAGEPMTAATEARSARRALLKVAPPSEPQPGN